MVRFLKLDFPLKVPHTSGSLRGLATKTDKDTGAGVVSTDKADGDVSRTLILRLGWRSAEATRFLQGLDKIHISNEHMATGRPGAWGMAYTTGSVFQNVWTTPAKRR